MPEKLNAVVHEILCHGESFLEGLHRRAGLADLVTAVTEWTKVLGRDLDEVIMGVEPSIRQSILMSLLPAKAFEADYSESYDIAIREHLSNIKVEVDERGIAVLRDICINIRKLRNLDAKQARARCASLADLKGTPALYQQILKRQNMRCLWCGIGFKEDNVKMTLEHVIPKHIGNDVGQGLNWGLSCASCNLGKADSMAWSTNAWAHDYLERNDFAEIGAIGLRSRWIVLRRSPECDFCKCSTREHQLWMYKRIRTGLPIPSNCSTTCALCAAKHKKEILLVRWAEEEKKRAMPRALTCRL